MHFRKSLSILSILGVALGASTIVPAQATVVPVINGFGSGTGFTVNTTGGDSASVSGGVFTATDTANQASSIFFNTPITAAQDTAWQETFDYSATGSGGAPTGGFTFLLQSSGLGYLGSSGTGLGFAKSGSPKTAATQFSLAYNGSSYGNNGVVNPSGQFKDAPTTGASAVNLSSGDTIAVSLTYTGGTTIAETLTDLSSGHVYSTSLVDTYIASNGGATPYVGITAGSGSTSTTQVFSNFEFSQLTPEPSGIATFATLGLGTLFLLLRKRNTKPNSTATA